jgi:hypothetical protein
MSVRPGGFFSGICALLLLCLAVALRPADAAEPSPLLLLEGYREINALELKQMLDGNGKTLVINVLSEMEYECQHIKGSINIPVVQMRQTDKLPADRETPLVFHCQSER